MQNDFVVFPKFYGDSILSFPRVGFVTCRYNKNNYHVPKELAGASLVNDHWLVNNWYNSTAIQKRGHST